MKRALRYIIFYAGLLGVWTLLAELKIWPPYLFPTPWGVAEALYGGCQDHSYWIAIRVSMQRVLIGYAIYVVLGTLLGLGVASNKLLEETMGALLMCLHRTDMIAVITVMSLSIQLGYIVPSVVFKGIERHLQNKQGLGTGI